MSGFIDPEHKTGKRRIVASKVKSAIAVLISLAIIGGGCFVIYTKFNEIAASLELAPDYDGPGVTDVTVTVPMGATPADIGDLLVEANVVKSTQAFLNAVRSHPEVVNIQAGTYKLKSELPAREALDMLLDTDNMLRSFVAIPEGLRLSQQLQRIAEDEDTDFDLKALRKAAKDRKALGLPDYAPSAEGFLFPNTYDAPQGTESIELLARMVAEYNAVAEDIQLVDRAAALKMKPLDLVIIASIVEREVNSPDDRAKVARVIVNRLAQDMPLQMDSTVHYAIDDYTTTTTTDEQRADKSPYNTYVHKGLPPGPISAPGRAALEAATSPAAGDWLYFVTVNLETGETRFANTLEEHEGNVALFQQWCQANPGKGC
ncbi:MAG TPA: endolytic transglycosylase MltG [Candidatus Avipropionibacterium avicola]|uniref:Endolytic murein transglycosylase n=1 Tax=Candidatus Avipropionibacterium avicola TaxID=2840701 RepID=A0A9D1H0D1_9ACTN|nr:endolytic transglycosylase MltG [Candidatus Avipropionibacterium avicola]